MNIPHYSVIEIVSEFDVLFDRFLLFISGDYSVYVDFSEAQLLLVKRRHKRYKISYITSTVRLTMKQTDTSDVRIY